MSLGLVALLAWTILLTACQASPATTTVTTAPTTSTSTTSTTADPRTEAERVYDELSPFVALAETEIGAGSAIVVGPELMVTNLHVVWPYNEVSLTFPNGDVFSGEVVAIDSILDVAVLEVPGLDLEAPPVDDGARLRVGSTCYLIGYPLAPGPGEPTIARGLLSSPRTSEHLEVEFLVTDATIESGQSGGMVASAEGVLGMSGYSVGTLAVALSMPDILELVEARGSSFDLIGAGDRRFPSLTDGQLSHSGQIRSTADEWAFLADVTDVESFEIESTVGTDLRVLAGGGTFGFPRDPERLPHAMEAEVTAPGPYLVVVSGPPEAVFDLTSSVPLVLLTEPDDGKTLTAGDSVVGVADFIGDLDWFRFELAAREQITITGESGSVGVTLILDELDGEISPVAIGEPGITIPAVSKVVFTSPEGGTYLLVVDTMFHPGGYLLTVK